MKKFVFFAVVFFAFCIIPQLIKQPLDEGVRFLAGVISVLLLFTPKFWPQKDEDIRRWIAHAMAVAFAIILMIEGFGIGEKLGKPLMLEPSNENADAIVVLAAGTQKDGSPGYASFQRVMHGLKLYKEGRAPLLLFSTGKPRGLQDEAKWVKSVIKTFCSPQDNIHLQFEMLDTRGEALAAANYLLPKNAKKILLVTNGSHIFRGKKIFEKAGFNVLPAPVQGKENLRYSGESSLHVFNAVVHEWLGLILYYFRGEIVN
ncbi:MAG: YdcF family protein [Candidatus Riflebacteria bacterium]|nr:YdcF family protein [Candidatus Riflebacteria bacterium]